MTIAFKTTVSFSIRFC